MRHKLPVNPHRQDYTLRAFKQHVPGPHRASESVFRLRAGCNYGGHKYHTVQDTMLRYNLILDIMLISDFNVILDINNVIYRLHQASAQCISSECYGIIYYTANFTVDERSAQPSRTDDIPNTQKTIVVGCLAWIINLWDMNVEHDAINFRRTS